MTLDLARALAIREQSRGAHTTILLGQVTAAAGTTVTATLAEQTVTMPRLRSYGSPTVGDIVLVLRHGTALYALGALNAAAVVIPEDPDDDVGDTKPPPSTIVRTRSFRPNSTGTWRDGRWRGDTTNMIQGGGGGSTGHGRNFGAAYYGNGPSSLSGSGVSGNVRVKRIGGGAYVGRPQTVTLRLLPNRSRPGGKPPFIAAIRGPNLAVGQSAVVGIPTPWVNHLIQGSAGGIGVGVDADYPHIHLAGRNTWSSAFQITLKFRR